MRVNELRIGNWIENGIGEAFQCNNTTIGEWVLANNTIGQIKPILLTEEWLVKFGFEVYMDTPIGNKYFKLIDDNLDGPVKFEVWMEFTKQFLFCIGSDAPFSNRIRYVHQLQNLFYALTGEELTIKE